MTVYTPRSRDQPQSQCACSLGYIVARYVNPLMQCLTNDIQSINMQLLTTKCLNTAVMMMFFFIGHKALDRARTCDAAKLMNAYARGDIDTPKQVKKLRSCMLRPSRQSCVYYVMINDGDIKNAQGDVMYFPGHVVVIEKFQKGDTSEMAYNVFQSYINRYDLKGYLDKSGNTFQYSYDDMKSLMDDIKYLFFVEYWDSRCVDIWMRFTKVDTKHYIGYAHRSVLSICFTEDLVTNCLDTIEAYVHAKLENTKLIRRPMDVFGNEALYDARQKPLTNSEMIEMLQTIAHDIKQTKSFSTNDHKQS